MSRILLRYFIVLELLLFYSCSNDMKYALDSVDISAENDIITIDNSITLPQDAFLNQVVANQTELLVKKKSIGELEFSLTYEPCELMILKDYDGNVSRSKLNEEIADRSHFLYFTLKIALKNPRTEELLQIDISSEQEYSERLQYFAFKLQDDLQLKVGADTINCCLSHFERIYGLASEVTVLMAFPINDDIHSAIMSRKLKERIEVAYNERIFNSGMIKFSYHPNVFNTLPKLEY